MSVKPLLPLRLSVKVKNWRMNDSDFADADAEFARVRQKALERDDYTCRFCGFMAKAWQEVHHFNDDHADNSLDNLVTTCAYCHMCQHIGLAGSNNEATLIYLPHISQADLHHIVRTAQVAEAYQDEVKADGKAKQDAQRNAREAGDVGRAAMGVLKGRQELAKAKLLTCDPAEIGNVLKMLPDDAYERRDDILAGIRLLPLGKRSKGHTDIMRKHVETWMKPGSGAYSKLRPNSWVGQLRAVLG